LGREKALRELQIQLGLNNQFYEATQSELGQIKEITSAEHDPALRDRVDAAAMALAEKAGKASPAALAPRVYIHIADETQRVQAEGLESRLKSNPDKTLSLAVPGIELKSYGSQRSELRCFRTDECQGTGRKIVDEINALLLTPRVELVDLSERYPTSQNIRAQHYELWFAKGAITLKP
jgi:hypothetical protein